MVHVNAPGTTGNRKRLGAAILILVVFPGAAAGYYYGYNVGEVRVALMAGSLEEFASLNVVISGFELKSAGALTFSSWTKMDAGSQTVDLARLQGTAALELGSFRMPAGKYSDLRVDIVSAIGRFESGGVARAEVVAADLPALLDVRPQGHYLLTLRIDVRETIDGYTVVPVLAGIDES